MNGCAPVEIERVLEPTAELCNLIAAFDGELAAVYTPEQRHGLSLAALFEPHVHFFLARIAGAAIGCGGVAFYPGYAEVKRLFVREDARGQGAGQALLACLEAETRHAGLALLLLETGSHQAAAMRLYQRAGFTETAAFGDYANMTITAIATSVFLKKSL